MRKKVLSMLVSLVLCFSTLPTAALAETADATAEKAQNGENITDIYTAGEEQDKENGYIAEQTAKSSLSASRTNTPSAARRTARKPGTAMRSLAR